MQHGTLPRYSCAGACAVGMQGLPEGPSTARLVSGATALDMCCRHPLDRLTPGEFSPEALLLRPCNAVVVRAGMLAAWPAYDHALTKAVLKYVYAPAKQRRLPQTNACVRDSTRSSARCRCLPGTGYGKGIDIVRLGQRGRAATRSEITASLIAASPGSRLTG